MATRKVQGGKRIDTWSWTVEGRAVPVEVYMAKAGRSYGEPDRPPEGSTIFHAVCEELDIRDTDVDINALKARAEQTVKTRVTVDWQPMLLVTLTGDRPPPEKTKWSVEDEQPYKPVTPEPYVFGQFPPPPPTTTTRPLFVRGPYADVEMKIEIHAIDIAEILGEKKHRIRMRKTNEKADIRDGWPDTGDFTKPTKEKREHVYSNYHHARTIAMIPDTPENRTGLIQIRAALETLVDKLDQLLHPDRIEDTLSRALASTAVAMLPESTETTTRGKRK